MRALGAELNPGSLPLVVGGEHSVVSAGLWGRAPIRHHRECRGHRGFRLFRRASFRRRFGALGPRQGEKYWREGFGVGVYADRSSRGRSRPALARRMAFVLTLPLFVAFAGGLGVDVAAEIVAHRGRTEIDEAATGGRTGLRCRCRAAPFARVSSVSRWARNQAIAKNRSSRRRRRENGDAGEFVGGGNVPFDAVDREGFDRFNPSVQVLRVPF